MRNIFTQEVTQGLINRINKLSPDTQPAWGTMSVDKMLAHCNVTYEMVYDDIHPRPGAFARTLLKAFVKNTVVNEKPYKRNSRTANQFLIKDAKVFAKEKDRLIAYMNKTQELGENYFDGKESHSFGPLKAEEWNNMFYKHLDHHLTQFGV